jgi:hypothetical protein
MSRIEPGLMFVGGAPVILPSGRITAGAWPELALAMLTEPEPAGLAASLSRLESFLKVDDGHREVIAARPARAASASEARRRAMLEQSMRAAQLRAPIRDPELVEKIARKEAQLVASRLVEADPPGKDDREKRAARKAARSRSKSLLGELADLRILEADQDRLQGEAKETILLARARGDDVIDGAATTAEFARDEYGARIMERRRDDRGELMYAPVLVYSTGLRAKRLTGIEHAHANGDLGDGWRTAERLHKIGVDYRTAYESAEGCSGGEGGGGGGSEPAAPQPRAIELSQKLKDFRKDLSPRQRAVLDMVCGQDMRVGEASRKMAAHPDTTKKALREGLDRAAKSRAEEVERRKQLGAPPASENLSAVTAILRRMGV